MKYVVIDFEFTDIPKTKKNLRYITKHEIIEIGAVKLDEKCNRIDTFSLFVKPEFSPLAPHCAALTGISNSDLENAPVFEEAFKLLEYWLGDDEYKIYTWSDSDKTQFTKECMMKGLNNKFSNIIGRHWTDLQKLFSRFSGIRQRMQLEKALNSLDIKIEGKMHRAIDDAINTAEILAIMKDKKIAEQKFGAIHEFFSEHEDNQRSTLGDILGDKLKLALA